MAEISLQDYKKVHKMVMIEKEKKYFKIHLSSYIIINSILIAANLIFSPQKLWFLWPLLGWGMGILSHYLKAVHWIEKDLEKKEAMAEERARGLRGT